MKNIKFIFFSMILLICGVLFFLHQESWITIHFPTSNTFAQKTNPNIKPKETPLWIFANGTLKKEMTEIIFSNDHAQTTKILLNNWLATMEEESIISQQITVQSVILSPSGQDAFICFSQTLFNPQSSTHAKLMIIESMLKTLLCADLGLSNVRMLVHHQPMQDHHLNFDISWPIHGYLN
jgi:hypothetical protein